MPDLIISYYAVFRIPDILKHHLGARIDLVFSIILSFVPFH